MSATLASVTRFLSLLSARDNTLSVPTSAHDHLVTATSLVEQHVGMSLRGGDTELTFDTYSRRNTAPGLQIPFFARDPVPEFDLPVRGPVSGLTVRYRGTDFVGGDYGHAFDWAAVTPLVEREHYVYDAGRGTIRLLFWPDSLIEGLQVSYGVTRNSIRDITFGDDLRAALDATRVDLAAGNNMNADAMAKLFSGIKHKTGADSATVPSGSTLSFIVMPPEGYDLSEVVLCAPRDVDPFAGRATARLTVIGPDNIDQTWEKVFPAVSAGGSYRLPVPPTYPGTGAEVRVSPPNDWPEQYWSRVDIGFLHPVWTHLDGVVHPDLSQATALLAARLYGGSTTTGEGDGGPTIPEDIRHMLAPHVRGKSGVRFI